MRIQKPGKLRTQTACHATLVIAVLSAALLTPAANEAVAAPTAMPVPTLNLRTAAGQIDLSQLKGRVVYVDFWASWCGPCRKSFPWLKEMQARYGKDGLEIVAINLDKDHDKALRFLREYAPAFTVAFDPQAVSARAFAVKGMPSSYLIDRDGRVVMTHVGFRKKDTEALESRIRALLQR